MDIQEKKDIRNKILQHRDSVDTHTRKQWDESIFNNLVNSDTYKKAGVIFAFVSFKSEVDTHRIISRAIEDKKIICVPRIESKDKGIQIFKIESFDQLKRGYFDILEPIETCPEVDKEKLDLILMPGVAFDRQGGRVGYGAAFYDRFLSSLQKHVDKIALAYHFQVLSNIPMDKHDIRIDGVITEKEVMLVNK